MTEYIAYIVLAPDTSDVAGSWYWRDGEERGRGWKRIWLPFTLPRPRAITLEEAVEYLRELYSPALLRINEGYPSERYSWRLI